MHTKMITHQNDRFPPEAAPDLNTRKWLHAKMIVSGYGFSTTLSKSSYAKKCVHSFAVMRLLVLKLYIELLYAYYIWSRGWITVFMLWNTRLSYCIFGNKTPLTDLHSPQIFRSSSNTQKVDFASGLNFSTRENDYTLKWSLASDFRLNSAKWSFILVWDDCIFPIEPEDLNKHL